jgi:hypothetical protein
VARSGYPDDPDNYPESDPTQYANYGATGGEAYSEYGHPTGYSPSPITGRYPDAVPPPTPWYQRPAALVGLGALTAAVLALLVYAVVRYTTAGTSQSPAVTSSSVTTPSAPTSESAAPPATTAQTAGPSPSTTAAPPPPTTVTTTVTPTTTVAPTTSEAPTPSTTTSITTSVTTVTETTTKPLWPTLPLPTRPAPTVLEPQPEG